MIIEKINPERLVLQVVAQNLDGTPKTVLTVATARVYSVDDLGTELVLLPTIALTHTVGSNVYRYVWNDPILDEGYYIVEYTLVDLEGVQTVCPEDIVITRQTATVTEIDDKLTQKHGEGSWKKGSTSGVPKIIPGGV